ncbi:family 2 glycosyl transferase [Clostridium sp. Mt-5]|uniref:Family 2 glycosyl transferase n=1 Tax=Clostridium moutaii TaxID=3240932 RepID=A0ABV4BSK1_9CLOT
MKKFIIFSGIIILLFFLAFKYMFIVRNKLSVYKNDNISYISKLDSKYFYIYRYGKWQKLFIKGVNVGASEPGSFPGDLSITEDQYLRWFREIAGMNADAIRVYTILKPEFYDALYEYNKSASKPLYVFQGVWINENDISKFENAYSPIIKNNFEEDIESTINIIHGNAKLPVRKGYASGTYTKDVSPYVIGWILGVEWDPTFVQNTNKLNPNKNSFDGRYLYTKNASPFEAFLSEIGDYAVRYETEKYGMQRPLSFVNWVPTDTLKHPNGPLKDEDMVSVNTEHIKKKNSFKPGLFASYHIYPYYPDFMNYQHEYADYRDKDGKINTYRAYLKDLIKNYKVPVLVAEFGVPSSRGMAHRSIYMGFNQGDVDEKSQGEMDAFMLQNISDEGYAGGLVFTWQDEWFKRTWNTMDLDLPDRRPYWSNPQTNEQEFGVLAFDPGENKSTCYVDGDISDWKKDKPLVDTGGMKLYVKSDEKYLYIMGDISGFDFEKDKLFLPIDITPNSGNLKYNYYNLKFKRPTDMVIVLDKKAGSKIVTDSYYDVFYYIYAHQLNVISRNAAYEKKNSGIFNPIYLCLSGSLNLPQDKKTIPLEKYETGKLVLGDANPKHDSYNSLTDYSVKGNKVEIRIPWQLLNVMDPSTKMIMDDFYNKGKITSMKIPGLYIGGILVKNDVVMENSNMELYNWKEWDTPTYHERLKPSYDILKKAFKSIGND